uniref:Cytosolic class II small heat-shock protein n=1 Tax=Rhizophora mucronata TaxID=61149 RepID=A0A2P2JAM2_RHIMU
MTCINPMCLKNFSLSFCLAQETVTSTVLDLGGGGCFSTTTVSTPFSHLAVMAETLASSGRRNFLISFWGALLSSRMYLQPSSSPSSRFLFPPLLITNVFSSSTVTYQFNHWYDTKDEDWQHWIDFAKFRRCYDPKLSTQRQNHLPTLMVAYAITTTKFKS